MQPFLFILPVFWLSTVRSAPLAFMEEQRRQEASALSVIALDTSEPFEHLLTAWASEQLIGPPLFESKEQLDGFGPFISPVLSGGLGHIMLQIAAVYGFSKKYNVPLVVAWWDQSNTSLPRTYRPYGGRGDPAPGITLKHIFPSLRFAKFEPAYRGVTSPDLCRCSEKGNGAMSRSESTGSDLTVSLSRRYRPLTVKSKQDLFARPFFDNTFYDPRCLCCMCTSTNSLHVA
jgi:hypothetical protein